MQMHYYVVDDDDVLIYNPLFILSSLKGKGVAEDEKKSVSDTCCGNSNLVSMRVCLRAGIRVCDKVGSLGL
jgi:hypothetical protein